MQPVEKESEGQEPVQLVIHPPDELDNNTQQQNGYIFN